MQSGSENFKKELETFANRLAKLPGLKTVNFSRWSLFGNDDALGYFCAKAGLELLGKCSGVEFVLPATYDCKSVPQRVISTNLFDDVPVGEISDKASKIKIRSKDGAIFSDGKDTLLWNECARNLVLSPVSGEAVEFEAFAEALVESKDVDNVDFNRLERGIGNEKIGFIQKKTFWKAMNAKSVDLKSLTFICPLANSELWGGVFDVIKNGVQSFGWDVKQFEEESDFYVRQPKNHDGNPGGKNNNDPHGSTGGGMGSNPGSASGTGNEQNNPDPNNH